MKNLTDFINESLIIEGKTMIPLNKTELEKFIYSSKEDIENNVSPILFSCKDKKEIDNSILEKIFNSKILYITSYDEESVNSMTTPKSRIKDKSIYFGFLYKEGSNIIFQSPADPIMDYAIDHYKEIRPYYKEINYINPASNESGFKFDRIKIEDNCLIQKKDETLRFSSDTKYYAFENIEDCIKYIKQLTRNYKPNKH